MTETARFGLISGPERPLRNADQGHLTVYRARQWSFTPFDARHSALLGLETLPDDNLWVLERRYISLRAPIVVILRRLELADDPTLPPVVSELARMDGSRGRAIDYFEAVAWHQGAGYFLISDDNARATKDGAVIS